MSLPPDLPVAFLADLAKSPLGRRNFDQMAKAETIAKADDKVLVLLARKFNRNYKVREFIRSLLPAHWVDYGGQRILACPRDNYTDFVIWRSHHSPEPASIAALQAVVIDRPAVICDIGANSGSFTLPLAAIAAEGSHVLAFEPNPVMAARLAESVAANALENRVTIHQTALSDRRGTATLRLVGTNFGEATLNDAPRAGVGEISVKVAPLADFLDDNDPRALVIKIDVEGHEDRVLAPYFLADPALRLPDVILIETAHRKNWGLDLVKLLKEKGYQALFNGEGNTLFMRRG